ncbi:ATP-dependent helicase [Candidatus Gracilibacteria bacterium]|nr:MAG: ATP-dependent helicase [Candidatus Gracilibacteria bacterium]
MKKTFRDLGIREDILEAIERKGYQNPSPIQEKVIPVFLNGDKDIIGQAQTGTGKTASFGIPLLQLINTKSKTTKAIILCPTRELAIQVSDEINSFSPNNNLSSLLLYGGNPIRDEIRELKNKPHLIIGTPGRVIDHLNKGRLHLEELEYFVLDEADEMLNIGFREEIEEIMASTPKNKKTLLFSATMPKTIMDIVKNYMQDYDLISVKSQNLTNTNIEQKYFELKRENRFDALTRIIELEENFYSIIFCKTKLDVDELASKLMSAGYLAEGIHGDVEQKMREKVLSRFKEKKTNILVATDVAARGIDVNDISHVVNYSLPENPETYTHRIGRTGRAGKNGVAITFVLPSERRKIGFFENVIKAKIKREELPDVSSLIEAKKNNLVNHIRNLISENEASDYIDLSRELLSIEESPEILISALIKKLYGNQLKAENYVEIKQVRERRESSSNGEMRLFVARGRKSGILNPGNLLNFIGTEAGISMKNAGKIEIFSDFSYINMPEDEADIVLQIFKNLNKERPLVVKAKAKEHSGSSSRNRGRRDGFRGNERRKRR